MKYTKKVYWCAYVTSTVKMRLHQMGFPVRVLAAYQSKCSFCHLKQVEFLDL